MISFMDKQIDYKKYRVFLYQRKLNVTANNKPIVENIEWTKYRTTKCHLTY